MPDSDLIDNQSRILHELEAVEHALTERFAWHAQAFSGMKDLDLVFSLIKARLDLALALIESKQTNSWYEQAQTKAFAGLDLFESILKENVSIDQEAVIRQDPQVDAIKHKIGQLLEYAGRTFFEKRIGDERKRSLVAHVVRRAIFKFVAPDDNYQPLFKTEKLPALLKKWVLQFMPVFGRENQQDPPYGIEEGEEETYHSEKIKLPLSQAVYYLEHEIIPGLEARLKEQPGDNALQQKLQVNYDKLKEYKTIHLSPRVKPFTVEKGFYTDTYSSYTLEGELLVSMPLSVRFRSGTNLDRMRFQIKSEIVKNLAGRGIHEGLDAEYRRLKKLESGLQGSSRTPSMKIDAAKWFIPLKKEIPMLNLIENNKDLLMLINTTTSGTKKHALRYLADLMDMETSTLRVLDPDE